MEEQWKAPWTYGWETADPAPAPPPPPPPPPPAGRGPRMLGTAVVVFGGAALLGGLLASCGPSGSGEITGVLATVPGASPATGGPGTLPAPPWFSAPATASGGAAADASAASPTGSSSPGGTGEEVDPAGTPSRSAHPAPARTPRRPRPAGRPKTTPAVPMAPAIKVCAEAERQGQWQPGSEQARICRNLYGG